LVDVGKKEIIRLPNLKVAGYRKYFLFTDNMTNEWVNEQDENMAKGRSLTMQEFGAL
jgi:hypothetical protein